MVRTTKTKKTGRKSPKTNGKAVEAKKTLSKANPTTAQHQRSRKLIKAIAKALSQSGYGNVNISPTMISGAHQAKFSATFLPPPPRKNPAKKAPTKRGKKVTIYSKGVAGIDKHEGYLVGVSVHEVEFVPRRGRRARSIMTYYSPFFMVVPDWGHPDPDSPWDPKTVRESAPGVTTMKGRYRSTDPRWVSDFLKGPGKGLKPLAVYENEQLTTYGKDVPVVEVPMYDKKIVRLNPGKDRYIYVRASLTDKGTVARAQTGGKKATTLVEMPVKAKETPIAAAKRFVTELKKVGVVPMKKNPAKKERSAKKPATKMTKNIPDPRKPIAEAIEKAVRKAGYGEVGEIKLDPGLVTGARRVRIWAWMKGADGKPKKRRLFIRVVTEKGKPEVRVRTGGRYASEIISGKATTPSETAKKLISELKKAGAHTAKNDIKVVKGPRGGIVPKGKKPVKKQAIAKKRTTTKKNPASSSSYQKTQRSEQSLKERRDAEAEAIRAELTRRGYAAPTKGLLVSTTDVEDARAITVTTSKGGKLSVFVPLRDRQGKRRTVRVRTWGTDPYEVVSMPLTETEPPGVKAKRLVSKLHKALKKQSVLKKSPPKGRKNPAPSGETAAKPKKVRIPKAGEALRETVPQGGATIVVNGVQQKITGDKYQVKVLPGIGKDLTAKPLYQAEVHVGNYKSAREALEDATGKARKWAKSPEGKKALTCMSSRANPGLANAIVSATKEQGYPTVKRLSSPGPKGATVIGVRSSTKKTFKIHVTPDMRMGGWTISVVSAKGQPIRPVISTVIPPGMSEKDTAEDLQKFLSAVTKKFPPVKEVGQVKPEIAKSVSTWGAQLTSALKRAGYGTAPMSSKKKPEVHISVSGKSKKSGEAIRAHFELVPSPKGVKVSLIRQGKSLWTKTFPPTKTSPKTIHALSALRTKAGIVPAQGTKNPSPAASPKAIATRDALAAQVTQQATKAGFPGVTQLKSLTPQGARTVRFGCWARGPKGSARTDCHVTVTPKKSTAILAYRLGSKGSLLPASTVAKLFSGISARGVSPAKPNPAKRTNPQSKASARTTSLAKALESKAKKLGYPRARLLTRPTARGSLQLKFKCWRRTNSHVVQGVCDILVSDYGKEGHLIEAHTPAGIAADMKVPLSMSPNVGADEFFVKLMPRVWPSKHQGLTKKDFPKVLKAFTETRAEASRKYPDLVAVKAAFHAGIHDSPRHFAMTAPDKNGIMTIMLAPELEKESLSVIRGVLQHEFGHAATQMGHFPEPKGYDEREWATDSAAESIFGKKIYYDKKGVETLSPKNASSPRPPGLR